MNVPETQGQKFDGDKARWDLVPTLPIDVAAQVFGFGAAKYGDRNWENGLAYSRLYGALLRHMTAWFRGEEADPESGLPHLGHALCCLLMLGEHGLNPAYLAFDDRPTGEPNHE